MEFSYGYAITTHKAQGSEWNNVVIWEEQFPYAKDEHKRWLYTAITRCSKKCVLIR
jgi:exodeoxyribonuclease-5